MTEFKIKAYKDLTFREGACSPVDLLAISDVFDFNNFENMRQVTTFALEHTEVLIGDTWSPVKAAGHEVYMPFGIEKKPSALKEIANWYTKNVILEVFRDSEGSTNDAT